MASGIIALLSFMKRSLCAFLITTNPSLQGLICSGFIVRGRMYSALKLSSSEKNSHLNFEPFTLKITVAYHTNDLQSVAGNH